MIPIKKPVKGDQFINRISLLNNLKRIYMLNNAVLIGQRRIGKSSIAEEFLRKLPDGENIKLRFSVNSNIGPPGRFAIRLLRDFLIAYISEFKSNILLNVDEIEINPLILVELSNKINSKSLSKLSIFLNNYYPAKPDNERTVLERILMFLEHFSIEMKLKTALVLDEFQSISELDNFSNFGKGKVFAFLEDITSKQENVWYLFTGSAVRMMEEIFEGSESPFYGRLELFKVGTFNKEDTITLGHKCCKKPISGEAINYLYNLSKGHPFYVNVIISAADKFSGDKNYIDRNHIEEAFLSEITIGDLDYHCKYLFDTSVGRIGQGATHKELLRVLSKGPSSLTSLANQIGRKTGNLSLPLRKLNQLDLIDNIDKQFFITDHILETWLRYVYGHNEPVIDNIRKSIRKNYQELIATLNTQTGLFFESYMREMLQKFNGQRFENKPLPKFDKVDAINLADNEGLVFGKPSNIEIDSLCLGSENWICEFKYTNKNVRKKDITILLKKKILIETLFNIKVNKIIYISKSPFSEESINSEVKCITLFDVNKLLNLLNMKKLNE